MAPSQIYVLETIVNRIELQPGVNLSDVESLCVGFKFAQIINFDIDTEHFTAPEIEDGSGGKSILMNYGKTFLFISKPTELRDLLNTDPYIITLFDGNKTIGSTTENWKREFSEMVKYFETLGIVKSTTVEDTYQLRNDKGLLAAKIDIFLRMSCFGSNLQTMFQIKKSETTQEYIFRQRNMSKTFKVEKYGDDRHQPLVAPLYSGITDAKEGAGSQINMKENVSLTQLFDRDHLRGKDSNIRADGPEDGIRLDFQDDFDKMSICYRPSENKFYDLLELISADVKTKEKKTEVIIQRKKLDRVGSFMKSVGGDILASPNLIVEENEDDIREMTADKIAKRLCGNKDCPAVRKFKEYGIGPLATGKSLGTVYGDVEPPVTYGMSHTYGTMCEYGPYGVFSRPKQEELPFVPRTESAGLPANLPCKMRKEETNHAKKSKKKKPTWHSETCPLCPQRLRGGADNPNLKQSQEGEDERLVMPKSPMMECKSVMDQFDNILAEYKKAVGPCGHATCPFSQTLGDDTCKRMCDQSPPLTKESSSIFCTDIPCNVDGCPYATTTKKRYPAGCGSPKCAYAKYKLGLIDEDAELELQYLPPALGGNCGDPHCKYPLSPPLPPIHWDCPDPLPKGPCKNLNCPFQPPPLKKFKTKKMLKTGPCGSPLCPYALPQPCGNPTCPFAVRPCPVAEEQKGKKAKTPPSSEEDVCENAECPFSGKEGPKEGEEGVDDQNIEGEFRDCANPECPFKKPDKKKKSKRKKKRPQGACKNPMCPSNISTARPQGCEEGKNGNGDVKSAKKCQKSSSSESYSVCSDPECPFASLKKEKTQKKKNTDGSGEPDSESIASCHKKDDVSICSNPECPEAKARQLEDHETNSLCNQSDCPFSKKSIDLSKCNDPNCPYIKPLPSCGIPNCPYEPIPLRVTCKNPKCPSKSVDFFKSLPKSNIQPTNQNVEKQAESAAAVATTTVTVDTINYCEDATPCNAPEDCPNPDCDMKEGPIEKGQGDQGKELIKLKKKGKRRKRGKFVYSIGDNYPGTKVGHKECVTPVFNVPPNMGWLWNTYTPILRLKPRRGWRPGALTKTIAARIRAHRQAKGLGFLRVPTFKKDGGQYDEEEVTVSPKPTLQIQKKEGAYWITMNPLKDPYSLVENEDPYMDCTPMTFKITKNKKPQEEFCYCDGEEPPQDELLKSSSSSDSELDIEFTPPAGIIHPERFKKRPNVICAEAQYDPKDFEEPKKDKKGEGKGKDKKGKGKKDKKGKGGKGGKGGKKKKK